MNRKFSTLMTAGLLVAGSVFSSAYAEKVESYFNGKATKIESGATYYLVEEVDHATYGDLALSSSIPNIDEPDKIVYSARYTQYDEANNDPIADIKQFQWIATESSFLGKSCVTFKNVATGKMLRVLKNGSALVTDFGHDDAKDVNSDNSWVFMSYQNYESALVAGGTNLIPAYANVNGGFGGKLHVDVNTSGAASVVIDATGASAKTFTLYKVQTEADVPAGELNELYNTAGFNLKLDDKYSSLTNLLNQEGVALKAIDVPAGLTANGFGFPKGTYFVTETPGYVPTTITADWLLNCTFIAVSSSDNVSTNAAKQNAGEGFTLTTVAGKDLNLMVASLPSELLNISADKRPCGSTINVNNAAFAVKKNLANGKYSLTLPKMYYAKSGAKVTDEQVSAATILDVKSDGSYSGNTVLVSYPTDKPSYIFSFVESNVVKGTEFISAEGKSIYNIQVGEYFLNNTMDNTTAKFYATGSALADLDAPAYQFVVTKVNGNEVTFTNRAYQNSITVKLFDEGNGWYSLATNATTKFTCLDIQNNGDVEENAIWNDVPFNLSTVKLIPAEAEEISGLDVEDGTQVTIAFARDFTPTSNKMYPVVNENKDGFEGKLTDEVAEAAQWQLVKNPLGPDYKTLTYAYLDADDKVAYKTKGDTVAYYTYKLQLVEDGNPVADKYLAYEGGYKLQATNVVDFKIKVNKDGSVVLTKNGQSFLSVEGNTNDPDVIEKELDRNVQGQTLKAEYKANDIKTYLVQDAPEVSLPATAKYVTLQSELGNYISMNEEGDAIVVSNEPLTFRVFATDLNAVVPSFFISTDYEEGARLFLFNPEDSVNYYVGAGQYDKDYQWKEDMKKAIFKAGILNETADTLVTDIKGDLVEVANKANNKGVKGGLNRFKFQIVLAPGEDDLYLIRQLNADDYGLNYLSVWNGRVVWANDEFAEKFTITETTSPTANEAVAAAEVSVVAVNGAIIVKGAAGKVVTVANILGQTIANQVAASDNVTIAAPAGIAVVTVDGEATKVVVK